MKASWMIPDCSESGLPFRRCLKLADIRLSGTEAGSSHERTPCRLLQSEMHHLAM